VTDNVLLRRPVNTVDRKLLPRTSTTTSTTLCIMSSIRGW